MPSATPLLDSARRPRPGTIDATIILRVIDRGADQGIDMRMNDPVSKMLCYEIVILDPDACTLIGTSKQSVAAFNAFCGALDCAGGVRHICVLLKFRTLQTGWPDPEQERNDRIYRMAEDLADDLLTHRPDHKIDIAMETDGGTIMSLM